MKSMTTLAQQVREAQKAVSSWSPQKKEAARLEGADIYLRRDTSQLNRTGAVPAPKKK